MLPHVHVVTQKKEKGKRKKSWKKTRTFSYVFQRNIRSVLPARAGLCRGGKAVEERSVEQGHALIGFPLLSINTADGRPFALAVASSARPAAAHIYNLMLPGPGTGRGFRMRGEWPRVCCEK